MVDNGDRIATSLRKGVVEFCVLALLDGGRSYGVDIARRLTAAGLIAGEGTLYPLLSRLRAAGHVTTEWIESEAGRPRRYYELTASGRAQLAEFRSAWAALRASVEGFLEEET